MSDRDGQILAALAHFGAGQERHGLELANFGRDLATIRGDLASLGGDLAKLRDDQAALRVNLMARMDRLQDFLTTMRDDILMNMARADSCTPSGR